MAVYGAIGHGGRGKTLSTVARLWKLYKQGRPIWSNTPLVDLRIRWDGSKPVPVDKKTFGKSWAVNYVQSIEDVLKARDCELLLDEVGAWVPADEWKEIPKSFRRLITQDRRNGINIYWTYRHTRIWNELRDNTIEFRYTYKYLQYFIVQRCIDAENPKAKPVYDWFRVEPETFQLYQTWAEVGDRNGDGYGMGALASRRGFRIVENWGDHGLTLSVTQNQWLALLDQYGPEALGGSMVQPEAVALGMLREELPSGVVRYLRVSQDLPVPSPL